MRGLPGSLLCFGVTDLQNFGNMVENYDSFFYKMKAVRNHVWENLTQYVDDKFHLHSDTFKFLKIF